MDAKTPKPIKTRATTAPTKPDPFAEFADWLIAGPAGSWLLAIVINEKLSEEQKRIVAANAALLADRKNWHKKVDAFEAALATISDDKAREAERAKYAIRFDQHDFGDGQMRCFEYRFPCSVFFEMANFGRGGVSFDEAKFCGGHVSFVRANFSNGYAGFDKTAFEKCSVSFREAIFGDGGVSFGDATFGTGNVSFEKATFGDGNVWFDGTNFGKGEVRFGGSTFGKGVVLFHDAAIASLYARDMIVAGNLYIRATFSEFADFRGLKVGGIADFSGSTFAEVPDFRDAKLDRPPEVARMAVPPPKLVRTGWQPFRIAENGDDVAKYRKLKAMALAANDHEEDGEFFAYEMLAKRGVETTTIFGLLFNTLYHQLGNFGQSYLRPLAWMASSFLSFAFIYRAVIGAAGGWPTNLLFALENSFRNSVPLFGALFKAIPAPKDHKSAFDRMFATLADAGVNMDLIGWIGMAQAFFGGVLLFLLLLALRNKFRLK
jgi:hypothetical protein